MSLLTRGSEMKRKALSICQGGNSRSVALAYLLKYWYDVDALACSWEKNTSETMAMLCDWAETIFVMQPEFREFVPEQYRGKIQVIDVGEDRWFNGMDPDLLKLCGELLQRLSQDVSSAGQ
jgi:predicted protein tyrosine phosphatase